ncbi:MAG: methyltransferase domain-containing protein [Bradymonadaceae bacterium]
MENVQEAVRDYYEDEVQQTEDLEYGACCTTGYDAALTEKLTDEVLEKRYGCGSPIPALLEGRTVVDLGCGAGADCFIASQLVGESGRVIGVDMSEGQLEVARSNVDPHMQRFGFESANVEFLEAEIEDVPLPDATADVVISNCVINLSPDKQAVYDEIWRLLKPGGEFHVSDVVADRRVPEHLTEDDELWSECLAGALYEEDLRRVEQRAGFADPRIVDSSQTGDTIEGVHFLSQVRRGFKLDLEDRCEDYGQVAVYRGTIDGEEAAYRLDDHHLFPAGDAIRVCQNTAKMLSQTRLADHFQVSNPLRHLGPFECADEPEGVDAGESSEIEVPETGGCC